MASMTAWRIKKTHSIKAMTNVLHLYYRIVDGCESTFRVIWRADYRISHCSILIKTNHLLRLVLVFECAHTHTQIHLHWLGSYRDSANYHGRWSILFRNTLHKCVLKASFIMRFTLIWFTPSFAIYLSLSRSLSVSVTHPHAIPARAQPWNALLTPFNNAHHFEYAKLTISIIISALKSCV